jgi:cystatin-A/B
MKRVPKKRVESHKHSSLSFSFSFVFLSFFLSPSISLYLSLYLTMAEAKSVAGGVGAVKAADEHADKAVAQVLSELETHYGSEAKAVEYSTQVVAGVNFFIKVSFKDNKFALVRVFRSLSGEYQLSAHKPCVADDKIEYFTA